MAFQYFDFECTWWRLFQKLFVRKGTLAFLPREYAIMRIYRFCLCFYDFHLDFRTVPKLQYVFVMFWGCFLLWFAFFVFVFVCLFVCLVFFLLLFILFLILLAFQYSHFQSALWWRLSQDHIMRAKLFMYVLTKYIYIEKWFRGRFYYI